jgi:hypothetical protein
VQDPVLSVLLQPYLTCLFQLNQIYRETTISVTGILAFMQTTADDQGRIRLPEAVRDRHGDHYRIVELPTHVVLLPIDDDPVEGIQDAVGDAFADFDHDDIEDESIAIAKTEIEAEIDDCKRLMSEHRDTGADQ